MLFASQKEVDPRCWYYLGHAYHLNYEFEEAIYAYESFKREADEKIQRDFDVDRQIEMCEFGSGLLSSIKDLVVLDKEVTGADEFFRFFDLDDLGGKILVAPEELRTKVDKKLGHTSILHFPGDRTTIYFSSYGKSDENGLDIYQAMVLPDGSFTDVKPVEGFVNTNYDESYPYLHPDGKTLYFASTGHNSMGGYDIFRSTLDPSSGKFSTPENLDFAINTPDDDIFYICDSLNNAAWFASARSSAKGKLHVYNVMVKSLPVNLLLMKGDFLSDINPHSPNAKILVTDQLTERPIAEMYTDPSNGDYLLSLPKPGQYKFTVEAEGSSYRHEGIVDIPIYDGSVAYRQEIRLIEEEGQEKLIIHNFFDEPILDDLAVLSQELLRQKAGLDVNATDELLAQLEEPEDSSPTLTIEKDLDNATLAAGFSEETQIEDVIASANADAEAIRKEVETIEENSNRAYHFANTLQDEAKSKLNEAETLMSNVDEANTEEYVDALKQYHELVEQAQMLNEQAYVAIETADQSINFVESERSRASFIEENMAAVNTAWDNNDFDAVVTGLREEKNRVNTKDGEIVTTPADQAIAEAKAKEEEEETVLNRVNSLRTEEQDLISDVERINKSLENTTKKSAINKLEEELAVASEQLTITQEEIRRQVVKANQLGEQEHVAKAQAEFYQLLKKDDQTFGLTETDFALLDEAQKAAIAENVSKNKSRAEVLEIDDAETLALIGEDTKLTRNDIFTGSPVEAVAAANGVELKTATDIQEETERYMTVRESTDPEAAAYANQVLRKRAVEDIDQMLQVYEAARNNSTDVDEINSIDNEINALNDVRTQYLEEGIAQQTNTSESFTAQDVNTAIAGIIPDYQSEISRINNLEESELTRSQMIQDYKRETAEAIEKAIYANEEVLLGSDEQEQVEALFYRNDLLAEAKRQLDEQVNDVTPFRAAYESENKQILESDDAIIEKLNEQIELTELYIAMLDEEIESTKSENSGLIDVDKAQAVNQKIEKLNGEKIEAQDKLNIYQSDLELTLSTDGDPGLTSVDTPDQMPERLSSSEAENISAIFPDYGDQWNAATTSATPEERTQKMIDLNSELVSRIDQEIDDRLGAMEASTDASTNDDLEMDIQRLENLRMIKENELNMLQSGQLASSAIVPEVEVPVVIPSDSPLAPEQEEEFVEVFSKVESPAPDEVYNDDFVTVLLESSENEAVVFENIQKMEELEAKLTNIELELMDAPEKKWKKLDKKRETTYRELAQLEVINSRKVAEVAQERYELNADVISSLADEKHAIVTQNEWLEAEVLRLKIQAQNEKELADRQRVLAGPEMDEIKQNFMYREAFTFDRNAIEIQNKIEAIYRNAEVLSELDESYLVQLKAGMTSDQEINSLADLNAVLGNETDSAGADSNEENALAAEETDTTTPREDATEATGVDESSPEVEPSEEIEEAIVEESPATILIDNRAVALADVVNRVQMDNMLQADYQLNESALDAVVENREVAAYLDGVNRLGELESERAIMVESRNAKSQELIDLQAQMTETQETISTTEDGDQRALLEADLIQMVNRAAVLYAEIDVADQELAMFDDEIIRDGNELDSIYQAIPFADIVAEANERTTSEPLTTTIENENPEAELGAPRSGGSFVMPSTPEEYAVMEYPTVLEEKIFITVQASVYNDNNPIPVNMTLPGGIVYKVQVGAFKNPVPSDHFKEFAPLAAEKVGDNITRYTAGLFPSYAGADEAKNEIRGLGYSDAFVVAFKDGVRVPLYDAKAETGEELVASTPGPRATQPTPTSFTEESPAVSTASTTETSTSNDAEPDLRTDYYPEDAAEATLVESLSGLFFTVQVGVYSKPVKDQDLFFISPLNSELLDNGRIRYTSGIYESLIAASVKKEEIKQVGVTDAFVTAYYDGKRLTIDEARSVLQTEGVDVLTVEDGAGNAPVTETTEFDLFIGTFADEVPSDVAKAMLYLEQKFGVFQIEESNGTSYFTARVGSKASAQQIQKEFEYYGVEDTRIRAFKNDIEIPVED
ncbi:MAG: hypothetical protein HKN32_05190 [Flavobacteriales bacterium]|nr:hypothetical protein [Flavobacteriales bacterium]